MTAKKNINLVNITGLVWFILCAVVLTGIWKSDLLFRMQELSLFLPNRQFLSEFLQKPGGLLEYAGTFFTQFFYYPWLGACILIFFLLVVQYAVYRVFRVGKSYYLLSFVPSCLLLLFITQLDYVIYILNHRGIVFSQITGFLLAVIFLGVYTSLKKYAEKLLFLVLFLACFYPIMGFYALWAALFMGMWELSVSKFSARSMSIFVFGLFFLLTVPWGYYFLINDSINIRYLYLYGLPVLDFAKDLSLWMPLIILLIGSAMLVVFSKTISQTSGTRRNRTIQVSLFLISVGFVFAFTNKDPNFQLQLGMERAMSKRDWKEMIRLAKNSREKPTRILVQYRNIALQKEGLLLDEMFAFPFGSEAIHSPSVDNATVISGYPVYYFNGRLNYCFRWCMESGGRYGLKADYLKYMAKVAWFNDQQEVARKCLETLGQTFFYKKMAKKYLYYLEHPKYFKRDKEYYEINSLLEYPDDNKEETNSVGMNIFLHYIYLEKGSREMLELSLAYILMAKDKDLFWSRLWAYTDACGYKTFPVHLQEAVLLYSDQGQQANIFWSRMDPETVQRFNAFGQVIGQLRGMPDEKTLASIREKFGNTYWYYYFFVNDFTI